MNLLRFVFVALLLSAPLRAGAAEQRPLPEPAVGTEAALREQRVTLKALQVELLLTGARAEWKERRELLRELKRARNPREVLRREGARARPVGEWPPRPLRAAAPVVAGRAGDVLGVNRRVNQGPVAWTQSEVGLASIGPHMVAAWNDGTPQSVSGAMSFSTSIDGGRTWRVGAPLPLGGSVVSWDSDPVIVADPARGVFWFVALGLVSSPATNAIAFMRGAFSDTGFVWERFGYARATRDTLPDKPWIAVDPRNGDVMLSYTSFYRVGPRLTDRIEFQRTTDGGLSWSPAQRLSLPSEEGLVQGSRPAVGPDGEVHVVWATVDTSDAGRGLDQLRICSSPDGGRSFGAPVTLARIVTNFASGAPGYNRAYAINFPTIAVDRSEGPHRGRIYVGWMESADFYSTTLGSLRTVVEHSGVGGVQDFALGDLLRGARVPGDGPDVFRFEARRGDNALFMLDSLGDRVDLALGVGCDEDPFQLAFSDPPHFGRPRVALVSFLRDGAYTLTVQGRGATGSGYRVRTGSLPAGRTRGRDVRDFFVTYSQDGVHWNEPARVNDAPPGSDDWLPEVAVGPDGVVYAAWYDWSDSPVDRCGAFSNTRLSRSIDGGRSWGRVGTLSDQGSEWSVATSNLVPNQGDYIGLAVDSLGVAAGWADARGGTPDIYFARFDPSRLPLGSVTLRGVSLAAPHPNPSHGELRVSYTATGGLPARIELWDVSGRRIQQQLIAAAAPAAELRLVLPAGLRAGVYLLRFTQGALSATTRVALVP